VLLFLIFLTGFLENGRCEGKKGRVIKRKKKKKKKKKKKTKTWSGIFEKRNEIVEF
jgi:hypothetical protein